MVRAKFCSECGASLSTSVPTAVERKVVSVLFCDLVGFTAASDLADPEDVWSRLVPYHRMLRECVEAFGGTVDKFIGDGVMAVFGAPTSHEDDAERAVRTGLAIVTAVADLNAADPRLALAVRVGINTGEAVVARGARPEVGEEMVVGDVVNTASRIESVAPVGTVTVGARTYEVTRRGFAYESLDAVSVKGKSGSLALWKASAPIARLDADEVSSSSTPLVGRTEEMAELRTVFDRVSERRSVEMVTLVGEPGVGKSRLVAELTSYVDSTPEPITWRQGRCLPYGRGVAFWAFGEIVKAHAKVFESDDITEAVAKLRDVLPPDEDLQWMESRLLPLLGIDSGPGDAAPAAREELFAAWVRFLESLADDRPAIIVFEDIHWADDALLAFVTHVVESARDRPLLLLCTARPELLERYPEWGAWPGRSSIIALRVLSNADISTIASALLDRLVPAETMQLVLDRAEGNPLFAQECVRVLHDRELLDPTGRLRDGDVPVPHGITALIAARIDILSPETRDVLADAAVVGQVFWAGALSAIGGRRAAAVGAALRELTVKDLIRTVPDSSIAEETELIFSHALVRDVAYSTVRRRARAVKHVAAATWLEKEIGDRVKDIAEVLAHHSEQALELAGAAGDGALVGNVTPMARRHALLAGDKVLSLDAAQAMRYLERALVLTPPEYADYPSVLVLWGNAAHEVGDSKRAAEAMLSAIAVYRERGQAVQVGATLCELSAVFWILGDPRHDAVSREAVEILESQPPGPALVESLSALSSHEYVLDSCREAIVVADRAVAVAAELHLPPPGKALGVRGLARYILGDRAGLPDIERGIALLIEAGRGSAAGILYNNLGYMRAVVDGPAAALESYREGERFAVQRGLLGVADVIRSSRLQCLIETGRLHEAVEVAADLWPRQAARGDSSAVEAQAAQARALLELGQPAGDEAEAALIAGRHHYDFELFVNAATAGVMARIVAGNHVGARALLRELAERLKGTGTGAGLVPHVPTVVRCALSIGELVLAQRLTEAIEPNVLGAEHAVAAAQALLTEATGDRAAAIEAFTDVAQRWEDFGSSLEQAYALLGLGRVLDGPAAARALHRARELFGGFDAQLGVAQCDTVLRAATERTARADAY